jgi:hypothetical protein
MFCALLGFVPACRGRGDAARAVVAAPSFFDTSPIATGTFGEDAQLRQRVLGMAFGEAAARLQALHFESRTQFTFAQGAKTAYSQADRAVVHQDTAGNLHVLQATPMGQIELYAVAERAYVRLGKGELRHKPRRDVDTDALPQRAYAGLRQVLELFEDPTYEAGSPATVGGRAATRYTLQRSTSPQASERAAPDLRIPAVPPGRWRENAQVTSLSGSVTIDNETGVVLQAEVDGRLQIPAASGPATQLSVHHSHSVTDAGRATTVRVPARSVPEFRRQIRPKDPLAFFRDQLPTGGLTPTTEAPTPNAAPQRADAPPPGDTD